MIPDPAHRASGEAPAVRKDPGASLVLPGSYAAVIFAMDGLLVDSEPAWTEAEAGGPSSCGSWSSGMPRNRPCDGGLADLAAWGAFRVLGSLQDVIVEG